MVNQMLIESLTRKIAVLRSDIQDEEKLYIRNADKAETFEAKQAELKAYNYNVGEIERNIANYESIIDKLK